MLIFAEGTVNEPLSDVERAAVRAWLGPMVDEGFIRPIVGERFPLERAADAHRYVQSRSNIGKVVLTC